MLNDCFSTLNPQKIAYRFDDLDPFVDSPKLRYLELVSCPSIKDVTPLLKLPELERIHLVITPTIFYFRIFILIFNKLAQIYF